MCLLYSEGSFLYENGLVLYNVELYRLTGLQGHVQKLFKSIINDETTNQIRFSKFIG